MIGRSWGGCICLSVYFLNLSTLTRLLSCAGDDGDDDDDVVVVIVVMTYSETERIPLPIPQTQDIRHPCRGGRNGKEGGFLEKKGLARKTPVRTVHWIEAA